MKNKIIFTTAVMILVMNILHLEMDTFTTIMYYISSFFIIIPLLWNRRLTVMSHNNVTEIKNMIQRLILNEKAYYITIAVMILTNIFTTFNIYTITQKLLIVQLCFVCLLAYNIENYGNIIANLKLKMLRT